MQAENFSNKAFQLFVNGEAYFSIVHSQEGSQRKSSEASAEEIGAKSPTRSRR